MFYRMYKKQIYLTLWIISFILILWIWYINRVSNPIEWLKVEVKGNSVLFSDTQIKSNNEFDYYQVYLYPNKFQFSCESQVEWLCQTVEKNKENLKTQIIWFFGHDLTKWSVWEVEIKTYFWEKDIDNWILKDLFTQLYVWNDFTKKAENGYEKYFEFKKQSDNEQIFLNQMEITCVEQIKQSIPNGSFDEENIVKERVKNECASLWQINPIDLVLWWMNEKEENSEVKLWIFIEELKLVYKFFKKEGKDFIEKKVEEKKVPSNIDVNSSFILKDLIK